MTTKYVTFTNLINYILEKNIINKHYQLSIPTNLQFTRWFNENPFTSPTKRWFHTLESIHTCTKTHIQVVGALCQTRLSQSTSGPPAAWISQPVSHFPLWKFPYFFVSRGTTTFERLRNRAGDGQGVGGRQGRIVEAFGVCGPIVNGDRLAEYVMATVSFLI